MDYKLYKLVFDAGVHIGMGKLSDAGCCIYADTLFSALCHEALAAYGVEGINKLIGYVKDNKLILSDGFPYIKNTIYIPKPMYRIINEQEQGSSALKKQYKKLQYIPYDKLDEFMAGKLDVEHESKRLKELGVKQLFAKSAVFENRDSELYSVGAYRFSSGCGIYFIVGTETPEADELLDYLFENLEFSGIGGKRNSGFGRFTLYKDTIDVNARLENEYPAYVALSVCMAAAGEIEDALRGSSYGLMKRSGFVASDTYNNGADPVKKKDFYSFKSGSVFRRRFNGDVFDVSDNGSHPVYRYAKPMLLGVEL